MNRLSKSILKKSYEPIVHSAIPAESHNAGHSQFDTTELAKNNLGKGVEHVKGIRYHKRPTRTLVQLAGKEHDKIAVAKGTAVSSDLRLNSNHPKFVHTPVYDPKTHPEEHKKSMATARMHQYVKHMVDTNQKKLGTNLKAITHGRTPERYADPTKGGNHETAIHFRESPTHEELEKLTGHFNNRTHPLNAYHHVEDGEHTVRVPHHHHDDESQGSKFWHRQAKSHDSKLKNKIPQHIVAKDPTNITESILVSATNVLLHKLNEKHVDLMEGREDGDQLKEKHHPIHTLEKHAAEHLAAADRVDRLKGAFKVGQSIPVSHKTVGGHTHTKLTHDDVKAHHARLDDEANFHKGEVEHTMNLHAEYKKQNPEHAPVDAGAKDSKAEELRSYHHIRRAKEQSEPHTYDYHLDTKPRGADGYRVTRSPNGTNPKYIKDLALLNAQAAEHYAGTKGSKTKSTNIEQPHNEHKDLVAKHGFESPHVAHHAFQEAFRTNNGSIGEKSAHYQKNVFHNHVGQNEHHWLVHDHGKDHPKVKAYVNDHVKEAKEKGYHIGSWTGHKD